MALAWIHASGYAHLTDNAYIYTNIYYAHLTDNAYIYTNIYYAHLTDNAYIYTTLPMYKTPHRAQTDQARLTLVFRNVGLPTPSNGHNHSTQFQVSKAGSSHDTNPNLAHQKTYLHLVYCILGQTESIWTIVLWIQCQGFKVDTPISI